MTGWSWVLKWAIRFSQAPGRSAFRMERVLGSHPVNLQWKGGGGTPRTGSGVYADEGSLSGSCWRCVGDDGGHTGRDLRPLKNESVCSGRNANCH